MLENARDVPEVFHDEFTSKTDCLFRWGYGKLGRNGRKRDERCEVVEGGSFLHCSRFGKLMLSFNHFSSNHYFQIMFIYLIPIALILNKLHRHPIFHTQLFLSKADSLYSLHPPVKTSISPQTLPLSQTLSLIFFLSPLLYRSLSVLPLLSFYINI